MPEFQQRSQATLQELGLVAEDFEHAATGARHVHVRSDSPQWAFVVAFQTPCENDAGCAHILEHLCLSGGQTYPVRGSFFHLRRRSLSTAMNAFTEADCTAFHFATTNARDFANLANVFLDATLTPLLHPLDFAQEAYRLERTTDGRIQPTGVVFNEMRGALNAASLQLALALRAALFPSTPYRYNEGGFPRDIAHLSLAELQSFHSRYYHSTNCTVLTHAPCSSESIQDTLTPWLSRTGNGMNGVQTRVAHASLFEPKFTQPLRQQQTWYGGDEKAGAAIGWVFGKRSSLDDVFEAALLRDILLGDKDAPLASALHREGFTQELLPTHEVAATAANLSLVAGFSRSGEDATEKLEQAAENAFRSMQSRGVPETRVRAALLALEIRARHGDTERHPQELGRLIDALPLLLHGCDVALALDHISALSRLRERAMDAHFVSALVERRLIDNPHRACVTLQGQGADDPLLETQPTTVETADVIALEEMLVEHQATPNPVHLLPRVSSRDVANVDGSVDFCTVASAVPCTHYIRPSAGLVMVGVAIDLSGMDESLTETLPRFCDLLTEVPLRGKSLAQTRMERASLGQQFSLAVCPGAAALDNTQNDLPFASLLFSGVALSENAAQLAQTLVDTIERCDFTDASLLAQLESRALATLKQRVARQGHLMAMHAAREHYNHAARLLHRTLGLARLVETQSGPASANARRDRCNASERLNAISTHLRHAPRHFVTVSDESCEDDIRTTLAAHAHLAQRTGPAPRTPLTVRDRPVAFCTTTSVNYCATTFPGVPIEHVDAPALAVLGPLLNELRLHPHLRERHGAYGSGAELHAQTASFALFSYRDPRLIETLSDLQHVGEWLAHQSLHEHDIDDAILGVLRVLDRRTSPLRDAKAHFFATLGGQTDQARVGFRKRVLSVNETQLRSAAERYLAPQKASIAVITNEAALNAASEMQFDSRNF